MRVPIFLSIMLLLIVMPVYSQEQDFEQAIKDLGISGTGIVGAVQPDGRIKITGGSLSAVPANVELLIDGEVALSGTRIAGKGFYKGGELVNSDGSSSLTITSIMTDIAILKGGGFLVKTKNQEITLTGGSIEVGKQGTRLTADDRIIEIGDGISSVDARGKDIFIEGKEIIFNGVWPGRIDSVEENGKRTYSIDVFGKEYKASGAGIEFTLDRIIIPESSIIAQGDVSITATKGSVEWHFSKSQFDISAKNAVFVEEGIITGKVASGGEIHIQTPKAEHRMQSNGKETIKSNARLDAMRQISRRINEIDPAKVKEGQYSFDAFQLQQWLAEAGYYKGKLDGMAGSGTRDALNSYLADNGIQPVASLNNNEAIKDRLGRAEEMQKLTEYNIVLKRKMQPDITVDESRISAGGNVIARSEQPAIKDSEMTKLDKKLEESLPRLLRQRDSIEAAVERFFPEYSDEEKTLIREHIEAKLIQETVAGAYLARINGEMIPSRATLQDNRNILSQSITEPLPVDELSIASFGLGQITLERFVDMLGKDSSLRQMTGISSPSMNVLYDNKVKQIEYASKLIDPNINAAVLAASTRDYLEMCRGDIDCESAAHNAGPGKARFGVPFQSKVWYLRQKVKEINPG